MRYKHLLSEEQLDELRMSPSSLRQFVDSPEAEGIRAGFEAELVFTGLGGEPEYDEDPEPDYDADERCRNLDQVVEFFQNDEYGYGLSDREAGRLRDELDESYYEWYDGQMYDSWRDQRQELIRDAFLDEQPWIERVHAVLVDGMELSDEEADRIIELGEARKRGEGKKGSEYTEEELDMLSTYNEAASDADTILDEEVESCIASEDKIYDSVLDQFRDDFYIDDDTGFFSDVGLRWMSDVANQYNLSWPVITYTGTSDEGGFSEDNARMLADSLSKELGVKTKVSGGYHSARRDESTWIFEPDSSLDADDSENMPVEIVSPPMPLKEALKKLEDFFTWAESNGAYANSSTGFHMGVSLPHRGGTVDYIKLALFLGDEYVLDEFGRAANHFCEAAMKKIKKKLGASHNQEQVGNALDLMRHNLLELATKALKIVGPEGFGKYTSINPKGQYIEFRSAGGSHYMEDIDRLKNMLMRYAKAMHVAAEPALERKEYYKKLYKLIAPRTGDASLDLFSRFATGSISKEELKKQWAEVALQKDAPSLVGKGDWVVINTATGKPVPGQTYGGYTRDEARARAKQSLSPASSDTDFDLSYEVQPQNTGKWEVYKKNDDGSEETLEIVDAERKGEAVDKVYDKYNGQNIDFYVRSYHGEKQPEKKLSRRAELAKRIRAPKPDWNVVYRPTGRVIDVIKNVSREEAEKQLVKVAKEHDFDSVDDLELHNKADADRAAQKQLGTDNTQHDGDWKLVHRDTGETLRTFEYMTRQEAAQMAITWLRDHQFNTSDFQILPKEEERYSSYADAQRAADQQNRREDDRPPAEGRMKKFRIADDHGNVWGPFTGNAQDAERELGQVRRDENPEGLLRVEWWGRDIEPEQAPDVAQNFSTNPNPTVHDDNQVRMPNGVPVWELYDRDTGHNIHIIADHTQREAWEQAQRWLRSVGAESPDEWGARFSIRPKMLAAGERNLSPTIRESQTAKRVFAEFDAYFESAIAPARKRLS